MKRTRISLLSAMLLTFTLSVIATTAGWLPYDAAAAYAEEVVAAPTHLQLEGIDEHKVTLAWYSPEAVDGWWDDFESHDDFAINSAGNIGWQYLDGDNRQTYTWNAATFPGQGSKMAFLVMNGSEMSMADGLDISTNPNFQPVSGRKMLVDFACTNGANNDYIISPELSFDETFQISFQARSYTVSYGAERVRVGYSTTGCRQSDFTFVTTRPTDNGSLAPAPGHDYLELPAAWTLIRYDIPAEARYVCVNCVSDDAFIFMLDDLFVGANNIRPDRTPIKAPDRNRLMGFNVYRNGQQVNTALHTSEVYTDQVPAFGTYDYAVTAVYADGTESAQSEPLHVEVADVNLLPFEDNFTSWFLDAGKWSTPDDAQGNSSRWGLGYYEYGLVNQSAVYSYSALSAYDQSLVSREMRTSDLGNTWLRYTLQHVCYQFEGVDYLDVEVKALAANEWVRVATHTNEKGSFGRTVFQYPLGELLGNATDAANGASFQLRFRAHGADAQYIDYWYVDDVKVWNPRWSSATLHLTDGAKPLAGITVSLQGDHGGQYTSTSDADGVVALHQIEEGNYRLSIIAEGYNPYESTLAVTSQPQSLDITLCRPRLELSTHQIEATDMATESAETQTLTLTNQGTGYAHWSLSHQYPAGSGDVSHRFSQGPSFRLSGDLQSSIVFDGAYFYTSSWYFLGRFYKYDREGRFIEEFTIPEMYYMVYDFAYDGRYVYASDYSNRIFQLDMDERRIVSVIDIPELPNLKITHLAYDPDRQGFWCGTFNTLVLVDRQGRQMSMEKQWEFAAYGSAYDNVSPGGPYLWVSDMTMPDDVIFDKVMLRQYDLNARAYTGVCHVVNDMPGYINGSQTNGQNQVCGVTITDQLVPGQLTLVGTLQQSPSLVYSYNVCSLDPWLGVAPMRGTLQPGESQEVQVGFSSLNATVGDVRSASLTLQTNPVSEPQALALIMHVTHATDVPRPQQLTASQPGQGQVKLTWQGSPQAEGYDIVRGDSVVGHTSDLQYTDEGIIYGIYKYNVRARYADGRCSLPSEAVEVWVKDGAPYYAPMDLTASIEGNKHVSLSWQSPLANVGQDFTLQWGTGENVEQLGVGSGYFYAGQKWRADELVPYRHKSITAVNVRICAPVSYLAARIYQDGKLVARTVFGGKVRYGQYTTIELTRPVLIVPGCDYLVAVQVLSQDGIRPLAMDDDTRHDGQGNLISLDGTTWYTAAQTAIEGNFNLSFVAKADAAEASEVAPTAYRIYRDGECIGQTTGLSYEDEVTAPGTHVYAVTSAYDVPQGDVLHDVPQGESAPCEPAQVRVLDICNRRAPEPVVPSVIRNRMVSLAWAPSPSATKPGASYTFPVDLTAQQHTYRAGYPEYLQSWQTQGTEMAVACDGRRVYTSVFNESGRINVYSLEGQYLGKVVIKADNLGGIRNLAWDGTSLWAADNSQQIHRLSIIEQETTQGLAFTGEVVASYNIAEYSRHLAYIPELNEGEGGFEVGDWNTSILVTRSGAKLGSGPAYNAAAGTAYYGGCIYAFEQNNPLGGQCVAVYDLATHALLRVIDLGQYDELGDASGLSAPQPAQSTVQRICEGMAGGASTFQTADGMTILVLCLQYSDRPSRLVFLDLSGSEGVTGYNVYRDGTLQAAGLPTRSYADTLMQVGDHRYQVSTCYLDGTESELSEAQTVAIVEPGEADAPVSVQATPGVYPCDVALTFADPHYLEGVTVAEDFESGIVGRPWTNSQSTAMQAPLGDAAPWTNLASSWVITDAHYLGQQALMAAGGAEAWLIIPTQGCTCLDFVACSEPVSAGSTGSLEVYYSLHGDCASGELTSSHLEDFILLDDYVTLPRWQQYGVTLPQGTEYVILRKPAECQTAQLIDAVRLHTELPLSTVYGYLLYRNGQLLTPEPVCDITYTDHNLPQGQYSYQARLVTVLSAESELSAPVTIHLDYDNGGQPPVNVRAEASAHGVQLTWEAPALGSDVSLAWHSGRNHDAAGLGNGGAYWAAVRWAPSDLAGFESLSVSEVEVYVNQVPEAMYIMLYEGSELRSQQLVERPQQYAFNRIALHEPLPINPQKELRLVVYVEHNEITVPLGYDEGPCIADGKSNIYSSDGSNWVRLCDEGTGIDANWNFGLVLRPYASARAEAAQRRYAASVVSATQESQLNALRGYKVYVNRVSQTEAPFSSTTFIDEEVRPGIPYLEYEVKAVYTRHGEVSAPILRIPNPMCQEDCAEPGRVVDAIETIASDHESETVRYNLQGVKVGRCEDGMVLRSDGAKVLRRN